MSIETTKLLMEGVIVISRMMEAATIGLAGLGICLLAAAIVRELTRTTPITRVECDPPPSTFAPVDDSPIVAGHTLAC